MTYLKHPRIVEGIQPPGPPEIVEIQRCNNAGIEWNKKMPAGPTLEGPKGEKLPEPPEGEDVTLEASDPRTDNWPPHLGQ